MHGDIILNVDSAEKERQMTVTKSLKEKYAKDTLRLIPKGI